MTSLVKFMHGHRRALTVDTVISYFGSTRPSCLRPVVVVATVYRPGGSPEDAHCVLRYVPDVVQYNRSITHCRGGEGVVGSSVRWLFSSFVLVTLVGGGMGEKPLLSDRRAARPGGTANLYDCRSDDPSVVWLMLFRAAAVLRWFVFSLVTAVSILRVL